MKANRVLNRKKENENKRKEDATEAISIMTNKSVQINFDYSKLQDINEEEKAKLMEIEKEIIFEGKKLGTIAVEIGKKLLEAKEVFIKSHSESFVEWYENLGFNKDQVSIFIKRYQMSIDFPEQKEKILGFSDRMIIQLNKKTTPRDIIEKVLNGEIKTPKEIMEKAKNISSVLEKKSDEIQEAEIVEEKVPLDKVNEQLEIVSNEFSRFEKIIRENNTKGNFEILLKIQGLLNEIK